jgi:hypothetical protein
MTQYQINVDQELLQQLFLGNAQGAGVRSFSCCEFFIYVLIIV